MSKEDDEAFNADEIDAVRMCVTMDAKAIVQALFRVARELRSLRESVNEVGHAVRSIDDINVTTHKSYG